MREPGRSPVQPFSSSSRLSEETPFVVATSPEARNYMKTEEERDGEESDMNSFGARTTVTAD
jgi:hypothetical protein